MSSFPSASAFAQHVLSSTHTPSIVKSTFTTARIVLGADAFELLLSLLTASSTPSSISPSSSPTLAAVQRMMAEVRPFAEDFHREKQLAKVRLVDPSSLPRSSPRRRQLGPLDSRGWASLTHAVHSICRFIRPRASELSVVIHPPQERADVASQTRALVAAFASLLPPLTLQLLLRDVVLDCLRPFNESRTHERLMHRIRAWLTEASDAAEAGRAYGEYKQLRKKGRVDLAELGHAITDVSDEDTQRMEATIKQRMDLREPPPTSAFKQQLEDRARKDRERLQREAQREAERVREDDIANKERARLDNIRAQAASLSLPLPPPLPSYDPMSTVPFDAAALSPALLPPPQWTRHELKLLERLQAHCHPLAYYHFRSYLAQLTAECAVTPQLVPAVIEGLPAYLRRVFVQPDSAVIGLLGRLQTLLLLPTSGTAVTAEKERKRPAVKASGFETPTPMDLPLERRLFLRLLMQQALSVHCTEVYLQWWRWQKAKETREEGEELKRLDKDIEALKARTSSPSSPTDPPPDSGERPAKPTEESAPAAPVEKAQKNHTRASVVAAASRVFGVSSPLVHLLRVHVDHLTAGEWTAARRWSSASEDSDYMSFHTPPSAPSSPPHSPTPTIYQQRYPHPLLEHSPSLVLSSSLSSDFAAFRHAHRHYKLFLHNLPSDMSPPELCFALRRLGEVRGGELFRERMKLGAAAMQMMKERAQNPRTAKGLQVLKMLGESPVYGCVYFAPSSPPLTTLPPSLPLFGISYRNASLYPVLAASLTRIELQSPVLRTGYPYGHLVAKLTALVASAVDKDALVDVGNRESVQESGTLVVTLRGHEEAVRLWERLRTEEFHGRRVRVSWLMEDRERRVVSEPSLLKPAEPRKKSIRPADTPTSTRGEAAGKEQGPQREPAMLPSPAEQRSTRMASAM